MAAVLKVFIDKDIKTNMKLFVLAYMVNFYLTISRVYIQILDTNIEILNFIDIRIQI